MQHGVLLNFLGDPPNQAAADPKQISLADEALQVAMRYALPSFCGNSPPQIASLKFLSARQFRVGARVRSPNRTGVLNNGNLQRTNRPP
jgi:hypothetical protein